MGRHLFLANFIIMVFLSPCNLSTRTWLWWATFNIVQFMSPWLGVLVLGMDSNDQIIMQFKKYIFFKHLNVYYNI